MKSKAMDKSKKTWSVSTRLMDLEVMRRKFGIGGKS